MWVWIVTSVGADRNATRAEPLVPGGEPLPRDPRRPLRELQPSGRVILAQAHST